MTPDAFWEKVDAAGDCWLWMGSTWGRDSDGRYGKVVVNGSATTAHRFAYETLVGPVPIGLHLDHHCRTRLCVNPDHLEPVTNRVNILRGHSPIALAARRQTCAQGHEYNRNKRQRFCRTCARESRARYHRATYVPSPRQSKTHCPQGHPRTEDNLSVRRTCLTCKRDYAQRHRDRLTSLSARLERRGVS